MPPIPADPMVCRWCTGPMIEVVAGVVRCQVGCSSAPIHTRVCESCRGEFQTGERMGGMDQCWDCAAKERVERVAQERQEGRPITGYLRDRRLQAIIDRERG
jgi:hypothetical protein